MQANVFIKEKLSEQHESFLKYCQEAGKKFVDELDREDFIAYRSEYAVSREQVEHIKILLNFQEQKSSEEILPPQNTFDEQENSLQKYFQINNLTPYKNISIADLNFSARVRHCLKRSGYRTLADLLKSSQQKLSSLKNFGQGSFDNLIATLKKFFDSRRKKIPAKTLRLANEELDEFLRDAALNHAPQVDLIISAFEQFCDSVTVKNAFRDLPEEFRDKRVQPFLLACGLKKNNLFVDLPDDLALADFPKWFAENAVTFNKEELINFIDGLCVDLRDFAKKITADLFKNSREFEIIRRRSQRKTLEEIGKSFDITRERVRQMEKKIIGRFYYHRSDAKKLFYFLHAVTDGKYILTLDDVKSFIDESDAEIIYFLGSKANLDNEVFKYDKEKKAFIFFDGDSENYFDDSELLENLPDFMDEKTFAYTLEFLARKKNCSLELIKTKLSNFYKRSGNIFYRGRLTLTFECGYVLKERFPNGYKIADENFYSRFMRYLQEIFDEKTPLTQRNVDAKIGTIGFLCDRGKYIHPDFVHISPEIIERVKNFIDKSDRTAIFYKEIFEALKNIFAGTQITNHYFLQGAIKFYKLPYTLRKDYLTKSDEIDMGKEFDNFVAERGEVSAQEIKENFISFKDFNIAFLVGRCPEIIRVGDGILIHATHLNLRAEDFEPIKNFLRKNCSTPVNSRVLFDLFFERFADFMTRNEIQNHNKLFGILQYMFRDEFNFSRPYISTADLKDISNKKFLLQLLESMEEIEIEDLVGICEENGINYVAKTYLIDNMRPDFVRVDEFTLMRPESIGVTDEIISAVVENIQSAVERNGGWQAAQTFEDYEWLPQLEISWNSFLLESVVSLADNAPYSLKIPSASANFSSTIFLSEEFAEDDFQSFLTKILIAEHGKEPFRSNKEIFDWLKTQGLCNKKLPKFLEGGRVFELLSE
ncbi:MAG: hypothetical protein IKI08_05825 [Selenomonadaceae bacterium]|nr:hypothetical protein [Selenomonadaceae bacterium]